MTYWEVGDLGGREGGIGGEETENLIYEQRLWWWYMDPSIPKNCVIPILVQTKTGRTNEGHGFSFWMKTPYRL